MAKQKTFTVKMPASEEPAVRRFFEENGFEFSDLQHAFWRAKGPGCIASFYRSGKLLMQGAESDMWRGLLSGDSAHAMPFHVALSKHPSPAPDLWVGTDEAGKGDYFGPLVVAGVALKRTDLELLQTIGVDDSKALNDDRIPEIARGIEAMCDYEVLFLSPGKYNELYTRIGNLNRLLAWAHGRVIANLLERNDATYVLVDKFANEALVRRAVGDDIRGAYLDQRTKAEEDPAVAAASVLARGAFLRGLKSLSRRFSLHLHPGAGAPTLASGRAFLETHGRGPLREVAKLHFKTTQQIGG
jgi:ribonuclease HIII